MKAACELVSKRYGANYANLLCTDNPRNVFEGKPLAEQEPPLHLFEEDEEAEDQRSWWKRLLRR
jgi:protein-tyrosine phosphatase